MLTYKKWLRDSRARTVVKKLFSSITFTINFIYSQHQLEMLKRAVRSDRGRFSKEIRIERERGRARERARERERRTKHDLLLRAVMAAPCFTTPSHPRNARGTAAHVGKTPRLDRIPGSPSPRTRVKLGNSPIF